MIKKTTRYFIKLAPLSLLIGSFPQRLFSAGPFENFKWNSPLNPTITSVEGVVMVILNAIITIAIPIVVLMIIYGGFMYVTAQGNPEQIKRATRTLSYAIIGGILIIGAVAITEIMRQTVDEFRTDNSIQKVYETV
jgi:hypothetical protein